MKQRSSVPSHIAAQLKSARARVCAPLVGERWLGVGVDQLVVLPEDGESSAVPWTDVESAGWDGDQRRLTVRFVDGREPLVVVAATDDVRAAVEAVRERVDASIVHVEFSRTSAGGDVRALIRRGARGALFSQVIARGPLDAADEDAAADVERRARDAVGL